MAALWTLTSKSTPSAGSLENARARSRPSRQGWQWRAERQTTRWSIRLHTKLMLCLCHRHKYEASTVPRGRANGCRAVCRERASFWHEHSAGCYSSRYGRGGIRTHGGLPHARFRVECLKPDSATLPGCEKERRTLNVQHPRSNANLILKLDVRS